MVSYVQFTIKNGSRSDPEHFRGITLLSSVSKLFQTVFRNRLTQWADGILLDNQTGFKAGYVTVYTDISKREEKKHLRMLTVLYLCQIFISMLAITLSKLSAKVHYRCLV